MSAESELDRYWLLTWTTYGNWLPGDKRGFVSYVPQKSGGHIKHNIPGTPYDSKNPGLEDYIRKRLKGPPVRLILPQAEALLMQFLETASHRHWKPLAIAIMANHCHTVVGVPGDPDPAQILGDFKSYGSRKLNLGWGKPPSGTWWTVSGSKRKLPNNEAVLAAIKYAIDQEYPLIIWTAPVPELGLLGGRIV